VKNKLYAFKLGAIDQKRYEINLARIAECKKQKTTDWSKRTALLSNSKFLSLLPADELLMPSLMIRGLVPHPDYYEIRAEKLSPDQQAEYLAAFRDGVDLEAVTKYIYVRLSSLLRSAIFYTECSNLSSLLAETQLLAELEPNCSY